MLFNNIMRTNRILLTGDDGYNSLGTRVLIHHLKDKYDISVVGTKVQQSGVGGKLTLDRSFKWGLKKVDGIEAIWVDGTPVDAIEFAQGYFKKPFDLVISGINWGENVTPALISSGTFSAAVRALGVKIAGRAIAMSYQR